MKKSLGFILLFFAGLLISVTYQSCGESTIKANTSNNDGLQVDVTPGDGNGDGSGNGNGSGGNGPGGNGPGGNNGVFSFNLGSGDNIFYLDGGGMSPNLRSGRLLSKLYYTILDSRIFEQRGTVFARDLSKNYCMNSAFPHCDHVNAKPCVGLGCYQTTQPVRCHFQARLSSDDVNTALAAVNGLQFLTRTVTPQDPMISDCDNPKLFLHSSQSSLEVSLADKACVSDGKYYASQGGDGIKSIFNSELDEVNALGDFCNNYSLYAWNTTKWTFKSHSGYTRQLQSQFRQVTYDNAKVNIRWKDAGDLKIYCADGVFVNPPGIDIFFPTAGLSYSMQRTNVMVADAPTASITYEDAIDGGAVREFYLDTFTAQSNSGGALLQSTNAQAMKDHIEVLVGRAKSLNLAKDCPTN